MFSFFSRFTRRGPVWDGEAERLVEQAKAEAEQAIAEVGAQKVRLHFGRFVQHPTGYYSSQIQTDRQTGGWHISDGGVIYGPWLAGTGSRNRTTRFKGYAHWRIARAETDAQAEEIASFVLSRYLPGGRR